MAVCRYLVVLIGTIFFACRLTLPAQEVTSEVFGYYTLNLVGSSDTFVSIPFARPATASGVVSNVSGSVVNFQGAPGWTNNQFIYASGTQSNTYYLRFDSGVLRGRYFDITNNAASSVTLNLAGGSLTGAANGDLVAIIPHWTLGTIFVGGNGVHLTTSLASRKTEVLVPNLTSLNKNLSAAATYYYYTNGSDSSVAWRNANTGLTIKNDDVIKPNTYVIVRHNVATNTTFVSYGDVVLTPITTQLRANTSNQVDNAVSLLRPLSLSLTNAGLIESGAIVPSPSLASIKDSILIYDNTTTNKNKSAAATYFYFNNGWRKFGASPTIDYGTSNVLAPVTGFIIRKATNSVGSTWTNSPTY